MTTVRIVDGASYGFKMVGLVFGLLVISGVLFALGGLLATGVDLSLRGPLLAFGQPAMLAAGGFFGLAGVVVLYAGTVGLVHKLIADSVTAGVENADQTVGKQTPAGEDTASDGTATDVSEAESDAEAETETIFDRENRRDTDPIAAESPSTTEPDTETSDPSTETAEPATERVEPESVDLVDEPTKKPGQASPSTEPVADAADERVADQGPEPEPTETGDDLDTNSDAPQDDSAEAAAVEDVPDTGAEAEPVEDTPDDSADVIDPVAESEAGDDTDLIESAPETEATADDEFIEEANTGDESPTEERGRPTPEDIDRAVSEATENGLGEESADVEPDAADDEALMEVESDATAEESTEDEPIADETSPDDEVTESERESDDDGETEPSEMAKADVIDRAFEQEEEEDLDDDTHTIIDDAIDEGEVEDTTDEPGDWEPLDESDLKD